MNIIFIGKRGRQIRTVKLASRRILYSALLMLTLVPAATFYGGYFVANKEGPGHDKVLLTSWQNEMDSQRKEIAAARHKINDDMDALALRLGELQAKMIRLDALGERLTEVAKLDKGEFDFSAEPAVGGPKDDSAVDSMKVPDFVKSLDSLSQQIDDRGEQLNLLESMLMNRKLEKEVMPAGRPIKRGWISSYFGMRTDPFTGRPEFHKGLDLAGKEGDPIMAVAAGVVTWAGKRSGYGNLVQINHGNGYSTRYGHNEKVLVKVGQTVKKGQTLALMGSTGRSTGPHCHFEVLYKGRAIDPKRFVLGTNNQTASN